jgi:8-oxo-dGTP pyrophosphatase MutT (NUDIX family)
MTARAKDVSVLLLVDVQARRIALARRDGHLLAPSGRIERGDGAAQTRGASISKLRLGADAKRAPAFQDAALRALYEELGQLIARPAIAGAALASAGGWGRLAHHRLAPDRAALTYLGRALDPADAPERRHARVFAASIANVSNSIKRRGRAERTVWMTPENAASALADTALEPFLDMAPGSLGGRPRPIMISFRAGQRLQSRL